MSNTVKSPVNAQETRAGDLTRTDAIRLWQDEKKLREELEKNKKSLLLRIGELNTEIDGLKKAAADDRQRQQMAQQAAARAQAELVPLQEEIQKLKLELSTRRDLRATNTVLEQSNRDLKAKNRELNQKVEQLRNHDFAADNAELRSTRKGLENVLDTERREHQTEISKLKGDHAFVVNEQAEEIRKLKAEVATLKAAKPKEEKSA